MKFPSFYINLPVDMIIVPVLVLQALLGDATKNRLLALQALTIVLSPLLCYLSLRCSRWDIDVSTGVVLPTIYWKLPYIQL